MRAFILVGGLGTRLQSLGLNIPKPMVQIGGRPFLEYLICDLRRQEVRDIVLCVGFGAAHIQAYFGHGQPWQVSLEYAEEKTPLGTGGAIRNALPFAVDENLILNGDSYLRLDYQQMLSWHRQHAADITVACTPIPGAQDYGQIHLAADSRILSFAEKLPQAGPALINAG
ncbi:NTP transferase domain-containing protein, partial [candidate division KSB1 bacterium]|nr:NTP transferase domain-containing protein [candidate division KSB1 bacterium]